jgi:hypothetical protein
LPSAKPCQKPVEDFWQGKAFFGLFMTAAPKNYGRQDLLKSFLG